MGRPVLVLNAGSSSLKCALFEIGGEEPARIASTQIETGGQGVDAAAVLAWAEGLAGEVAAVGHRVVHGGAAFHEPTRLTAEVIDALQALTPLAPLHQPQSLAAVRAIAALRPDLPQVACFDTAFHWSMPAQATRFGLPRALHDQGVRRYGFHGLSYEYIAGRLAALDPQLAAGKVIVAHLGSGASLCAMAAGRSVETTMGFSPLDGLLMSTRCGALDPGVVLYLLQHEGMDAAAVQDLLYHRSGLLGVSGLTSDMRQLLESSAPEAREAVELFVYDAAKQAGALAMALEGLDGIVFTAGIGENSAEILARIAVRLGWLGLELDEAANMAGGEGRISTRSSRLAAWVIPTNEELVIARQTARCVAFAG